MAQGKPKPVNNSEEAEGDENDLEDEVKGAKIAKHDAGVSDLEKVTDYAEEKEIASQDIQEVSCQNQISFY